MAEINKNLENLFKNYKQQQEYAKYQKASAKDKKDMSLWGNIDLDKNGGITNADKTIITNNEKALLLSENLFDFNNDGKVDTNDMFFVSQGMDLDGADGIDDDEKEFLKKYKTNIITEILNNIRNNNSLSVNDVLAFEQEISKMNDADKKFWKSEITKFENQIITNIKAKKDITLNEIYEFFNIAKDKNMNSKLLGNNQTWQTLFTNIMDKFITNLSKSLKISDLKDFEEKISSVLEDIAKMDTTAANKNVWSTKFKNLENEMIKNIKTNTDLVTDDKATMDDLQKLYEDTKDVEDVKLFNGVQMSKVLEELQNNMTVAIKKAKNLNLDFDVNKDHVVDIKDIISGDLNGDEKTSLAEKIFMQMNKTEIEKLAKKVITDNKKLTILDLVAFENEISKMSAEDKKAWKTQLINLENEMIKNIKANTDIATDGKATTDDLQKLWEATYNLKGDTKLYNNQNLSTVLSQTETQIINAIIKADKTIKKANLTILKEETIKELKARTVIFTNGLTMLVKEGETFVKNNDGYVIVKDKNGQEKIYDNNGNKINGKYIVSTYTVNPDNDGKLYLDGTVFTGEYQEEIYLKGEALNGYYSVTQAKDGKYTIKKDEKGLLYQNGKPVDKITIGDNYYEEGKLATGYDYNEVTQTMFKDGIKLTGQASNNKYYLEGKEYSGVIEIIHKLSSKYKPYKYVEIVSLIDANGNRNTINNISDDSSFKVTDTKYKYCKDGELLNGTYTVTQDKNNNSYSVKNSEKGLMYKNGEIANNISIDNILYINGQKAQGIVGNKHYTNGILTDGEYFDEETQTMFIDGEKYTGNIGVTNYSNGKLLNGTYIEIQKSNENKSFRFDENGSIYADGTLYTGIINVKYESEPVVVQGLRFQQVYLVYEAINQNGEKTELQKLDKGTELITYTLPQNQTFYYSNGSKQKGFCTTIINEKPLLFNNGDLFSGKYEKDGKFYFSGEVLNGLFTVKEQETEIFKVTAGGSQLYKDGKPFTGKNANKIYFNGNTLNGRYTVIENGKEISITESGKNAKFYYDGEIFNGYEKNEDCFYFEGEQINGKYTVSEDKTKNKYIVTKDENGKMYECGKLLTGKSFIDNKMYNNGDLLNGKYAVEENQDGKFTVKEDNSGKVYSNGNLYTGEYENLIYLEGEALNGHYDVTQAENGEYTIKEDEKGLLYQNGKPVDKITIGDNYYEEGKLATGYDWDEKAYTMYHEGGKYTGLYEEKYYAEGKLANGVYENKCYSLGQLKPGEFYDTTTQTHFKDGLPLNGLREKDGKYYYQGVIANKQEIDGIMYNDGQPADKLLYNGCLYLNGKNVGKAYEISNDDEIIEIEIFDEFENIEVQDLSKIIYKTPGTDSSFRNMNGNPLFGYFSSYKAKYYNGYPYSGFDGKLYYFNGYPANEELDGLHFKDGKLYTGSLTKDGKNIFCINGKEVDYEKYIEELKIDKTVKKIDVSGFIEIFNKPSQKTKNNIEQQKLAIRTYLDKLNRALFAIDMPFKNKKTKDPEYEMCYDSLFNDFRYMLTDYTLQDGDDFEISDNKIVIKKNYEDVELKIENGIITQVIQKVYSNSAKSIKDIYREKIIDISYDSYGNISILSEKRISNGKKSDNRKSEHQVSYIMNDNIIQRADYYDYTNNSISQEDGITDYTLTKYSVHNDLSVSNYKEESSYINGTFNRKTESTINDKGILVKTTTENEIVNGDSINNYLEEVYKVDPSVVYIRKKSDNLNNKVLIGYVEIKDSKNDNGSYQYIKDTRTWNEENNAWETTFLMDGGHINEDGSMYEEDHQESYCDGINSANAYFQEIKTSKYGNKISNDRTETMKFSFDNEGNIIWDENNKENRQTVLCAVIPPYNKPNTVSSEPEKLDKNLLIKTQTDKEKSAINAAINSILKQYSSATQEATKMIESRGFLETAADWWCDFFGVTSTANIDTAHEEAGIEIQRLCEARDDIDEFKKIYNQITGVEFDPEKILKAPQVLKEITEKQQALNINKVLYEALTTIRANEKIVGVTVYGQPIKSSQSIHEYTTELLLKFATKEPDVEDIETLNKIFIDITDKLNDSYFSANSAIKAFEEKRNVKVSSRNDIAIALAQSLYDATLPNALQELNETIELSKEYLLLEKTQNADVLKSIKLKSIETIDELVEQNAKNVERGYSAYKLAATMTATLATGGLGLAGTSSIMASSINCLVSGLTTLALGSVEEGTKIDESLRWKKISDVANESAIAGIFTALGIPSAKAGIVVEAAMQQGGIELVKGTAGTLLKNQILQKIAGGLTELITDTAISFSASTVLGQDTTVEDEAFWSIFGQVMGYMIAGGQNVKFTKEGIEIACKNIAIINPKGEKMTSEQIETFIKKEEAELKETAKIISKPEKEPWTMEQCKKIAEMTPQQKEILKTLSELDILLYNDDAITICMDSRARMNDMLLLYKNKKISKNMLHTYLFKTGRINYTGNDYLYGYNHEITKQLENDIDLLKSGKTNDIEPLETKTVYGYYAFYNNDYKKCKFQTKEEMIAFAEKTGNSYSLVGNLDDYYFRNIESTIIKGDRGTIVSEDGINLYYKGITDTEIHKLGITKNVYEKLFPLGERFIMKQNNGSCFLLASFGAIMNDKALRVKIFERFTNLYDSAGNVIGVRCTIAAGNPPHYKDFMNFELDKWVSSSGKNAIDDVCLGLKMLEQTYIEYKNMHSKNPAPSLADVDIINGGYSSVALEEIFGIYSSNTNAITKAEKETALYGLINDNKQKIISLYSHSLRKGHAVTYLDTKTVNIKGMIKDIKNNPSYINLQNSQIGPIQIEISFSDIINCPDIGLYITEVSLQ